ncbi:hypothetical protein BKA62DRAFT_673711 [Auriculariales sp. MPI-PUGE-AT-0066]|nr:hypothetical protein BKA62DRAFT_673711 [Auriculariales sp. MPI-PUGE-AT-0066]
MPGRRFRGCARDRDRILRLATGKYRLSTCATYSVTLTGTASRPHILTPLTSHPDTSQIPRGARSVAAAGPGRVRHMDGAKLGMVRQGIADPEPVNHVVNPPILEAASRPRIAFARVVWTIDLCPADTKISNPASVTANIRRTGYRTISYAKGKLGGRLSRS